MAQPIDYVIAGSVVIDESGPATEVDYVVAGGEIICEDAGSSVGAIYLWQWL